MERRRLFQSFAFGSLAATTPLLPAEAARITITDLEIFTVKVNSRGNWVFTRLRTSAGVHGIHGKDALVVALLRQFFERLKGRGTFDIELARAPVARPPKSERKSTHAISDKKVLVRLRRSHSDAGFRPDRRAVSQASSPAGRDRERESQDHGCKGHHLVLPASARPAMGHG
jgi:hypothetical protein